MQQQITCGACGWSKTSSVREASKCYALHTRHCKELKRLKAEGVVFVEGHYHDKYGAMNDGLKETKRGNIVKAKKIGDIKGLKIFEGGTFQTDDAETMLDMHKQINERKLLNFCLNLQKEFGRL